VNKALFLDRDGTILKEIEGTQPETLGYLTGVEQVELIDGAADALADSHNKGYLNIVITNQSAIARGWLTEEELEKINKRMYYLLNRANPSAIIDDLFYSPFFKDGIIKQYSIDSPTRKPGIALLMQARDKYNIDLDKSFMIGDSFTDMKCGNNAGIKSILVMTGYGKLAYRKCLDENLKIDFIAANLHEAVHHIMESD
jgi:D,D-heptose 1,7-bisphosphate phosphatase